MKISYSTYILHPKKKANRLSSLEQKPGVWIKGEIKNKVLFADYFPHLPLGDRTVDQFLQEFKFQDHDYDKKVFNLLLKDDEYQRIKPKKFFNHELWSGSEPLESKILKYKIKDLSDRSFIDPLKKGVKVRLDANGLFDKNTFQEFLKDIPENLHHGIDYIEDPLAEKDWENLKFKTARDFIEGSPFDFYIYKPNCEFLPSLEKVKVIFSSYMGSALGNWHAYAELIKQGDLSLTHGIVTKDFYEEEYSCLDGSYENGFLADQKKVRGLYKNVYESSWKQLCSM